MAEVVIYTRAMCGFCTRAKSLLEREGIPYEEIDATFDPARRQEMIARANGRSTFPQIFVGRHHVGGCDDLFALHREGRLRPLLEAA